MQLRDCWDPSVPSSREHPELPLRAGRMTSARGPCPPRMGGTFQAGTPRGLAGTKGKEDTMATIGVEVAHQVTSHTVRAMAAAPKFATWTTYLENLSILPRRDGPTRSDHVST